MRRLRGSATRFSKGDRNDDSHMLSRRMMQAYIGSYWLHFSDQVPIIHKPDLFARTRTPSLLLIAMMTIGARYCGPNALVKRSPRPAPSSQLPRLAPRVGDVPGLQLPAAGRSGFPSPAATRAVRRRSVLDPRASRACAHPPRCQQMPSCACGRALAGDLPPTRLPAPPG